MCMSEPICQLVLVSEGLTLELCMHVGCGLWVSALGLSSVLKVVGGRLCREQMFHIIVVPLSKALA